MFVSSNIIVEIITLLNNDWLPYNGQPEGFVYENLGCKHYQKKRPSWFIKDKKYLCVSCQNKCVLHNPAGFQLSFPAPANVKKSLKIQDKISISPLELVNKKSILNIYEVCYCLNVSYSKVYNWVQEGKLIALKEKPLRVKSSDVKAMMEDFDE